MIPTYVSSPITRVVQLYVDRTRDLFKARAMYIDTWNWTSYVISDKKSETHPFGKGGQTYLVGGEI
jgi:hypothetical protein